jgi:hypothetical protein
MPKRKISPVITLFFVAPLVAEYLLGDLPLKLLPALIFLAPAHGGGAILIRETARRARRGWPTMLLLGRGLRVDRRRHGHAVALQPRLSEDAHASA